MNLDSDGVDMKVQIDAYLDGALDPDGAQHLQNWIVQDPDHARRFMLRAEMHHHLRQLYSRNRVSQLAEGLVQDTDNSSLLEQLAQMEDSAVVTSLVDITDRLAKRKQSLAKARQADPAFSSLTKEPRVILVPRLVAWGALAAAVVAIALILLPFLQNDKTNSEPSLAIDPPAAAKRPELNEPVPVVPPQVAVMIKGLDARWATGGEQAVSQSMRRGAYQLTSGRAKLRFENGAILVLEGPARFNLDADDAMSLHDGKIVAYCNPEARGFKVSTPHALFTDLGTEFGVCVKPSQASQLHVFRGEVQVDLTHDQGGTGDDHRPVFVVENQAIAAGPSERTQPLRRIKVDSDLFRTTRYQVVASLNTGADLSPAQHDRQWMVVRINDKPIVPAVPAVLFIPPTKEELGHGPVSQLPEPIFLPNREGRLCWIKPDPDLVPDRGIDTTTYRTTVDLSGYQPDSAKLDLRYNADNSVWAIRLNGQPLELPESKNEPPYVDLKEITASEGFVPGENQIEIVVFNEWPNSAPELIPGTNYTGLVAEVSVTAQPDWISTD